MPESEGEVSCLQIAAICDYAVNWLNYRGCRCLLAAPTRARAARHDLYVARTVPGAYARRAPDVCSRNRFRALDAPAAVHFFDHLRAQDGRTPARRGHHRLRHGESR